MNLRKEIDKRLTKDVIAMIGKPVKDFFADWTSWAVAADYLEERNEPCFAGFRAMAKLQKCPLYSEREHGVFHIDTEVNERRPRNANRVMIVHDRRVWSETQRTGIWSWHLCWSHLGLAPSGLPLAVWVNISCHRARLKNRHHKNWLQAVMDGALSFTKAISEGMDVDKEMKLAEEAEKENVHVTGRVGEYV